MVDENKKMYIYVHLCMYFRMCLSLHDYQSEGSRRNNGLTYLKNRITTDQKHTVGSEKQRGKELKRNTKENHQTTKEKTRTKVIPNKQQSVISK